MKTTTPLLSVSALAIALLFAPPALAEDQDDLSEKEAQSYARELLEPESERDGLEHIREDEQEEHGYPDDENAVRDEDLDTDQAD